jgi:hypothetical protein
MGTSSGLRQFLPLSMPNIWGGTTPHQRSSPHVASHVCYMHTRSPERALQQACGARFAATASPS